MFAVSYVGYGLGLREFIHHETMKHMVTRKYLDNPKSPLMRNISKKESDTTGLMYEKCRTEAEQIYGESHDDHYFGMKD